MSLGLLVLEIEGTLLKGVQLLGSTSTKPNYLHFPPILLSPPSSTVHVEMDNPHWYCSWRPDSVVLYS
jgi:hypothetical protein